MQYGVVSSVLISESHVLMTFFCSLWNSLILHKMLMLFCLLKLEAWWPYSSLGCWMSGYSRVFRGKVHPRIPGPPEFLPFSNLSANPFNLSHQCFYSGPSILSSCMFLIAFISIFSSPWFWFPLLFGKYILKSLQLKTELLCHLHGSRGVSWFCLWSNINIR